MAPHDALIYLAGLEQSCSHPKLLAWDVPGSERHCPDCNGSGKAPVLNLRAPCPCWEYIHDEGEDVCANCSERIWHSKSLDDLHAPDCYICAGRNWVPKQDEQALYQAMHDAGWSLEIHWFSSEPLPSIGFYSCAGHGSNPYIAAQKAMQSVGYK